ncbi:unnamed protein product [Moneuplotes crassus]|uniref:RING-type domain-containing protein n=1 Tax=Euplotes crassus TaxID=5936 RepID=A0AAD1XBH4_EUPCR|nr:unnamed protein product [Moneuplotes crassus]
MEMLGMNVKFCSMNNALKCMQHAGCLVMMAVGVFGLMLPAVEVFVVLGRSEGHSGKDAEISQENFKDPCLGLSATPAMKDTQQVSQNFAITYVILNTLIYLAYRVFLSSNKNFLGCLTSDNYWIVLSFIARSIETCLVTKAISLGHMSLLVAIPTCVALGMKTLFLYYSLLKCLLNLYSALKSNGEKRECMKWLQPGQTNQNMVPVERRCNDSAIECKSISWELDCKISSIVSFHYAFGAIVLLCIFISSFFDQIFGFLYQNIWAVIVQNSIWILMLFQSIWSKKKSQIIKKEFLSLSYFLFMLMISLECSFSVNYHFLFGKSQQLYENKLLILLLIAIHISQIFCYFMYQIYFCEPHLTECEYRYKNVIQKIQFTSKGPITPKFPVPTCDYCTNNLADACVPYITDNIKNSLITSKLSKESSFYIISSCSHHFHQECFTLAYEDTKKCPICKSSLNHCFLG